MRRTGFALAAALMLVAACGEDPSEEVVVRGTTGHQQPGFTLVVIG